MPQLGQADALLMALVVLAVPPFSESHAISA